MSSVCQTHLDEHYIKCIKWLVLEKFSRVVKSFFLVRHLMSRLYTKEDCLMQPPSLCSGEFVAQFKFTVLLMANGPLRITNSLFEPELYKSEHEVEDPELKVNSVFWIRCCILSLKSMLFADLAFWKPLCVLLHEAMKVILALFFSSSQIKALLQSSASRKTQKKKKKKVSHIEVCYEMNKNTDSRCFF